MRFISGFEGNSLKIMMQLPVVFFVLFCFTPAFTLADICYFYKFLEVHSALFEKLFSSRFFLC